MVAPVPPAPSPSAAGRGRGRGGARSASSTTLLLLLLLAIGGARAFVVVAPVLPAQHAISARPLAGPAAPAPAQAAPGGCRSRTRLAATTRRGGRGGGRRRMDEEEEEGVYEDDELGDEVARIVGYGEEGRPLRRNRNQILEWLRDLYHKIFWFGLEGLADDDDDYYLDQIDWLGEWNTPQEVGGGDAQEEEDLKAAYEKGGNGRLFRGAFPFDRQTYPPTQKKRAPATTAPRGEEDEDREVVLRKVGEREETPLWRNVRPSSGGDDSAPAGAAAPARRGGGGKTSSSSSGRKSSSGGSGSQSPLQKLAKLEEQKQVLTVSRDVWKRRVAEALRETAGAGSGGKKGEAAAKLAKARARLQEIDQELEDLEVEMRELRLLITTPSPSSSRGGVGAGASAVEDEDADEEDEDSRI